MIMLYILPVLVIALLGYMYLPRLLIGIIQKSIYKDGRPINSFEPRGKAIKAERDDGSYYVSEIAYGNKYPNSHLDIIYHSQSSKKANPTVIYFHGGGFFAGDKAMGDPMAAEDDAGMLLSKIVTAGYNLVSVNYALVPDYRFPTPLIQMNEAITYLYNHSDELELDMKRVVLFGQSAGAVMVSQYAALLTSEEYRSLLKIEPTISKDIIKALVIDDAPLNTRKYNFALWAMMSDYIGSSNRRGKKHKNFSPLQYITNEIPPTFMTAGNTDGFPEHMQELSDRLSELGVENEYYFRDRSHKDLCHGYLNQLKDNEYARECLDHILSFINVHTK